MRVESKVKRLQKGVPISVRVFRNCGPGSAVRVALSRLVKRGLLVNVARGIYARPKPNQFFGHTLPGVEEVAVEIARLSGEQLSPHGAELARRLGLSTQMPVGIVFHTTGRTRSIRVRSRTVYFQHAPAELVRSADTLAGQAMLALNYLGPEGTTPEALQVLIRRIPREALRAQSATAPGWLRVCLGNMGV